VKDVYVVNEFMSRMRTEIYACSAGRASIRKELKFRSVPFAFRIVAPETIECAPFQEHRRTDARTVVGGEALYIEYSPCRFHGAVQPLSRM
jgi:hypothetical protein